MQLSSGAKCQVFGLKLHLLPFLSPDPIGIGGYRDQSGFCVGKFGWNITRIPKPFTDHYLIFTIVPDHLFKVHVFFMSMVFPVHLF